MYHNRKNNIIVAFVTFLEKIDNHLFYFQKFRQKQILWILGIVNLYPPTVFYCNVSLFSRQLLLVSQCIRMLFFYRQQNDFLIQFILYCYAESPPT